LQKRKLIVHLLTNENNILIAELNCVSFQFRISRVSVIYITAVLKESIRRDIYRAMYSLITGSITDSQDPVRTITVWNHSAFPQIVNLSKTDFPIIVYDKPTIDTEPFTYGKVKVNWNMDIIVYTAGDKAAEKNNTLTDEIYEIFNGAVTSNLRNDKQLHDSEIVTEDTDVLTIEGIKTHETIITFGGFFVHNLGT